uniref:Uncharacterized protein n=1 Tax=Ixodes ricinus TaxID=34613 RepID=A0A6B0V726_IXORI
MSFSCRRRHNGSISLSARNWASFWSFFCLLLRLSRAIDWFLQKVATARFRFSPDSPSSMSSIIFPMSPTRGSCRRLRFIFSLNDWWISSSSSKLGNRRSSSSTPSTGSCCSRRGWWNRRIRIFRLRTCVRSVWNSSLMTSCLFISLGLSRRRSSSGTLSCHLGGSVSHSRSESSRGAGGPPPSPPPAGWPRCTASHDWLGLSRLLADRLEFEELPELFKLLGLSSTSTSLFDLGILGSLRFRYDGRVSLLWRKLSERPMEPPFLECGPRSAASWFRWCIAD